MLLLFDTVVKAKAEKKAIQPMEILSMLADAVTLIGHASYLASLKRREFLKPDISSAYQSVCSKSNPVTTFLFGDELPIHIKDIRKVNKISKKTLVGLVQLGVMYLNIRAITTSSLDNVEGEVLF